MSESRPWPATAEWAYDRAGGERSHDAEGLRPALPGHRRRAIRPGLAWLDRLFHASHGPNQDSGAVPGGGQHPSGAGRANGGTVRTPRSREHPGGPDFGQSAPKGGYIWWYVDGISADGKHAITLIAFVGSVFSPYYAIARGVGFGDPQNHCALNVALYGRSGKYWTLTERTRRDLDRQANTIQIGPSRLDWDGKTLTVFIDEVTVPFPSRVLGTVRLRPQALTKRAFALDTQGRHCWHPIAPCAEIEVTMQHPSLRWSGRAYWDCNFGDEPLEAAFQEWDWTRAQLGDSTTVLYDITPRGAPPYTLALRFDPTGKIDTFQPPPRAALHTTYWRVRRYARSDDGRPSVLQTLEDTPFYARSLIAAHILGTKTLGVHESLSLKRVANPVVRAMLPFRMPRRRWRRR